MIRKTAATVPGYVRIFFELPSCLWADRIFLVGDFNQWDETATAMPQDRDGVWRVIVELPQGHSYEFRYWIDGKWMSDSHADGFVENGFGISNSIVHTTLPVTTLHDMRGHVKEIVRRNIPNGLSIPPHERHFAFGSQEYPRTRQLDEQPIPA
ncbi:MAG: isoamylase early set domain-containing protein [Caldilineaceae bacterium]